MCGGVLPLSTRRWRKGRFCVAEIGDATLPVRVWGSGVCWLGAQRSRKPTGLEGSGSWIRLHRLQNSHSAPLGGCLLLRLFRIRCGKEAGS